MFLIWLVLCVIYNLPFFTSVVSELPSSPLLSKSPNYFRVWKKIVMKSTNRSFLSTSVQLYVPNNVKYLAYFVKALHIIVMFIVGVVIHLRRSMYFLNYHLYYFYLYITVITPYCLIPVTYRFSITFVRQPFLDLDIIICNRKFVTSFNLDSQYV